MTRDEIRTLVAPLPDPAIFGLTLYGEARGEPIDGLIAVACAVRNRVTDPKARWGKEYRAVCLQKAQFSCWAPVGGAANHQAVLDAARVLLAHQPASALLEQCAWVALGVAQGALLDTVSGGNHYHTVSLIPRPSWAAPHTPVMQRGAHLFYRL